MYILTMSSSCQWLRQTVFFSWFQSRIFRTAEQLWSPRHDDHASASDELHSTKNKAIENFYWKHVPIYDTATMETKTTCHTTYNLIHACSAPFKVNCEFVLKSQSLHEYLCSSVCIRHRCASSCATHTPHVGQSCFRVIFFDFFFFRSSRSKSDEL